MKKQIKLLAFLMLILGFMPIKSWAQNVDENGVLKSWMSPPANLVMPDNVIKIADNCFCDYYEDGWDVSYYPNPDITTVYFNNTQIIGKQAFYMLPKLKTIVSAAYVKEIMEQAFAECNSLEAVDLPAIETLGKQAFSDCQFLNSIHLGKNLKTVGAKPFKNCPELASLTMEEGGDYFMVRGNMLISKSDGKVMGAITKTEEFDVDEAKIISEYVFQNNENVKKIVLNNVTELEDGAFCRCTKLADLRLPKLEKVPGWAPAIFSGCTSLQILDLHESENFDGFDALTSLPDNNGMKIYVANETIKSKIENNFTNAKVIVGAPEGEVKTYHVTYTWNSDSGTMDVWGNSGVTVLSGSDVSEHSRITFKAIPMFKCQIGTFKVNGEDVTDKLIMNSYEGKYEIEDVVSDLNVEVEFIPETGHLIFFGASPADAGKVTCKLTDGTEIQSPGTVPANSKLFFEARPILTGFHIDTWVKEESTATSNFVKIEGQEGKKTYECVSEDGLDIRVLFEMDENHHVFQFKNQNEKTGTIKGYVDGKEIESLGAYPHGSNITLKVTPSEDGDINAIRWYEITKDDFIELKEYENKTEISFTLNDKRAISVLCSHEEKPEPGANDPVITNGHLTKWEAVGEVTIPEEVEYIDKEAFRGAMEMTKLTFNKNVKYIGEAAFLMCSELTEIVIPEENQYFKSVDGVVYTKDGKKLVVYPGGKKEHLYTLPANVEEVVAGSLLTTPRLEEVAVEDGNNNYEILGNALVRKADKTMVYYPNAGFMKTEEPKLTIDDRIEAVGRYALAYIPALTIIEIPDNFKRFEDCSCLAGGGLSEIKAYENHDLKDVQLEEIGDSAFFYNMSLVELPYMKNLKKIGKEAFARNYNLVVVNIPADCEIGHMAFDYAMALSDVRCWGTIPSVIDDETFTNITYMDDAVLEVPYGCKEVYESAEGWKNFKNIMEFDAGIATGINDVNINTESSDNAYYTLEGIKVNNPVKNTLYIHNGKKIIFK